MMTMTSQSPGFNMSAPVRTDADVLGRVDRVVDPAARQRRSLWLLFFGAGGRQLPVVAPIDGIPVRVGPELARPACHVIAHVLAGASPGGFAVVALTRPGGGTVTGPDRSWAGALRAAAGREGAAIRMICLATRDGVLALDSGDARSG